MENRDMYIFVNSVGQKIRTSGLTTTQGSENVVIHFISIGRFNAVKATFRLPDGKLSTAYNMVLEGQYNIADLNDDNIEPILSENADNLWEYTLPFPPRVSKTFTATTTARLSVSFSTYRYDENDNVLKHIMVANSQIIINRSDVSEVLDDSYNETDVANLWIAVNENAYDASQINHRIDVLMNAGINPVDELPTIVTNSSSPDYNVGKRYQLLDDVVGFDKGSIALATTTGYVLLAYGKETIDDLQSLVNTKQDILTGSDTISLTNNTLSVNTTNVADVDSDLPITSKGVYTITENLKNLVKQGLGGFTVIDGILSDTDLINLYTNYEDGKYSVVTEEYGAEIVIIDHTNNLFKRFSGGYDYTYDFDLGDWVVASGGGGEGGGGAAGITLVAQSPLEKTIPVGGSYSIQYYFKPSQGSTGTVKYYVDNILKKSASITKGVTSFNIGEFIKNGENQVKVEVTDTAGITASLVYFITGVELRLTSNFDDGQAYTGTIDFRYTPYGDVAKTVNIYIDGILSSTETIYTSGERVTSEISNLTHGVHTINVTMSAVIDGETMEANELNYQIIYYVSGTSTPIISSKFNKTSCTQGELLSVDYMVYTPGSETSSVTLSMNNETVNTLTVGRTRQYWNLINYPYGTLNLSITTGAVSRTFSLTVTQLDIDVSPVSENLQLYLTASGRSNSETTTRSTWEYENISATMSGFNWSTNGWMSDSDNNPILRLNGTAKVTIPFQIFATNFLSLGKTIEFDFATKDVADDTLDLVTCGNITTDKGFNIKANECTIKSEQTTVYTKFKEDERVRVSFVVGTTSDYRLVKTFINGVLSGLQQYPINDDFTQTTPSNIIINPNGGSIDIYSIRVYNQDLTDKQMLNNYIADLPLSEKINGYTRNDILDQFGRVSYSKVADLLPVMIIDGQLPGSKGDKKVVSVSYTDPFDPSNNFEYSDVTIDVQGTSSQYFPRKNYKLKFKNAFSFYQGAIPEKVYTMKTDYMESSHSHNTGNAKIVNNLAPTFPTQTASNGVRNAIYGFPCVIFHRENDNLVYYGVFNFNNDKSSPATLGLTTEHAESWEFANNTSAHCLFRTNNFGANSGVANNLEARYPEDYTDYTNISRVISWVYSTDGDVETFADEFEDYFNKNACLFYYVFMEMILGVDSRAKNMFLDTTDGTIWYPRWYDIDTCYGLNNEGVNQFSYGLEQHDSIDGVTVYNGENSLFWNNFEEAFADDIAAYYRTLRSSGKLTYESMLEVLKGDQIDKISERLYNTDGDFKYVGPLRDSNDATYLYVEQGNRLNHLQYWLSNRFKYLDSKYQYSDFMNDYITMRLYTPNSYQGVAPDGVFKITPYVDTYIQVKYGSNTVRDRGVAKTETTINPPVDLTFNNTETIIYGASKLSDIGNLAGKYARTMDFSKATKLTKLIIGSNETGYSNTNLTALSIGNNKLLEELNIRNCPNLTQTIDLSGCLNVKTVLAAGTSITGVTLAEGGNLETLELPNTITNLTLLNQPNLDSLTVAGYSNLVTLRIENCPGITVGPEIVTNATNLAKVRLININWTVPNADHTVFASLANIQGMDEFGNTTDYPVITGSVHIVGSILETTLASYAAAFPNITFTADTIIHVYTMTFKNYDNTILETKQVQEGASFSYTGATPTKPEDATYVYIFNGWSPSIPLTATESLVFTAQFTQSAKIIATFKNYDGTVLQTVSLAAGQTPSYTGNTPTRVSDDPDITYEFIGWSPTIGAISVDTEYTAQYKINAPIILNINITSTIPTAANTYISVTRKVANQEYTVDWGDGTTETYTATSTRLKIQKSTAYSSTGTYKIKISTDNDTDIGSSGWMNSDFAKTITSILLPGFVKNINTYTFYGCTSLTSITIPSTIENIRQGAFYNCTGLTSVTISNGVTTIGDSAFYNCTSLSSITIPNSVTSIGSGVFSNCTSLTSVTLPSGLTSIKNGLFNQCSNLTSVTIPNSVTSIEGTAFQSCTSLTSITLPSGLTSIGDYAFYSTKLSSITIPANVTTIGSMVFSNCNMLTEINVNSSNTTYFSNSGVLYKNITGGYSIVVYPAGKTGSSYTIINNTISIGDGAFYYAKLTSIIIPNSVTSIGNTAFRYCNLLESITLPTNLTSIGNYAFEYDSALKRINSDTDGVWNIPNSVTSIGSTAFGECSSAVSVTLPSNLTTLNTYTFQYCTSLTSVTLPSGLTSIGASVFVSCSNLSSITIPANVTTIGDSAFWYDTKLESVICNPTTPPTLGTNVFNNNKAGRIIYVPSASLTAYQTATNWSSYSSDIQAIS